jgi:hypothetical protein
VPVLDGIAQEFIDNRIRWASDSLSIPIHDITNLL